MTLEPESYLNAITGHYSETCALMKTTQKQRDTYFFYLIILLIIFSVQYKDKTIISNVLCIILKQYSEITPYISELTTTVLWVLLAGCTTKYFQTEIYLKKTYKYIQKIENSIQTRLDSQLLFSREGKSYLQWKPKTYNFTRFIYQQIIPLTLTTIALDRSILHDITWASISFNNIIISLSSATICTITTCYNLDIRPKQKLTETFLRKVRRYYHQLFLPIVLICFAIHAYLTSKHPTIPC